MKKHFSTKNVVDFLKFNEFTNIKPLEQHEAVDDFSVTASNDRSYYVYASNFSMSIFNQKGVFANLSTDWQNYLCEVQPGYANLLVKFLEEKLDNKEFLYKQDTKLNGISLESLKDHNAKMETIVTRIENIKRKYLDNNLKV